MYQKTAKGSIAFAILLYILRAWYTTLMNRSQTFGGRAALTAVALIVLLYFVTAAGAMYYRFKNGRSVYYDFKVCQFEKMNDEEEKKRNSFSGRQYNRFLRSGYILSRAERRQPRHSGRYDRRSVAQNGGVGLRARAEARGASYRRQRSVARIFARNCHIFLWTLQLRCVGGYSFFVPTVNFYCNLTNT